MLDSKDWRKMVPVLPTSLLKRHIKVCVLNRDPNILCCWSNVQNSGDLYIRLLLAVAYMW